ncbi:hypothetical protein F6Q10_00820 [Streptomyces vinaceus]|nr:hypothetical protein [Streptomyces vinaceus]
MTTTVLIGLAGFAFAGILTVTRCLDVLMHRLLAEVRRPGGSSSPPRWVPWTRPSRWVSRTGRSPCRAGLSRTSAPNAGSPRRASRARWWTFGTVFVPLVPWTEAAACTSATLGAATTAYAAYPFPNQVGGSPR